MTTPPEPSTLRQAARQIAAARGAGEVLRVATRAFTALTGARRAAVTVGVEAPPAWAEAAAAWPLEAGGERVGVAYLEGEGGEVAEILAALVAAALARETLAGALAEQRSRAAEAEQRLRLQERLASLGTAVSGIAHELRNPIGLINSFAELSAGLAAELAAEVGTWSGRFDREKSDELGEMARELAQNLAKIRDHARRAEGIVRSTLQRSRARLGQPTEGSFNTLVREYALSAAEAQPPERTRVPVELCLDGSAGQVRLVPEDFGRVVLNLVANALDAARARAAELGDEHAPAVRVSTRGFADTVEVRVHDNGGGVPAALRERLFEPFFTTKPSGEGTGLGLSISREIVKAHGGSIDVSSEPGVFTEFVVRLPRG
jgi:signal transduction histidine kinase